MNCLLERRRMGKRRVEATSSIGKCKCRRWGDVIDVLDRWNLFKNGFRSGEMLKALKTPYRNALRVPLEKGTRRADRKTTSFFENLLCLEPALRTCMFDTGLEPTKHHAECLLRSGVLWRKHSVGTQSEPKRTWLPIPRAMFQGRADGPIATPDALFVPG